MQRRPIKPSASGSDDDEEGGLNGRHVLTRSPRHSSAPRRSLLGLANRIWALVAAILLIVLLTHAFLPSSPSSLYSHSSSNYYHPSSSGSRNSKNNKPSAFDNLKPHNYLNGTRRTRENPFEFCRPGGEDELKRKWGEDKLAQSRLNLGSGARVQRVIQKALSGQAITISVLGGSSAFLSFSYYITPN